MFIECTNPPQKMVTLTGKEHNCAFVRGNTIIIFGNALSDEVVTFSTNGCFNTQPRSIYPGSQDWIPYYGRIIFNFSAENSPKN
jgi:hypothetical protein